MPGTRSSSSGCARRRVDRYETLLALLAPRRRHRPRARGDVDRPWFLRELAEIARDPEAPSPDGAPSDPSTPAPPSSRRAPRTTTRAGTSRAAGEVRRVGRRVGRDTRVRAEPHRPGNRVRLLLRPRRDDRSRVGPRSGDDQLQPRDGLHRLRHLRPPLLRAAHARGRARRRRERRRARPVRRGDRAVRRPDSAAARRGSRARGRSAAGHAASARSTSPRTAGGSARCCESLGYSAPPVRRRLVGRPARSRAPRRSAIRSWSARPTCSAAERWRSSTRQRGSRTTSSARGCRRRAPDLPRPFPRGCHRGRRRRPRATARTSGSAGSCSTSRRPACTPATAPASCRRTRSARRCSSRSAPRRARSRSRSASSG